MSDNPTSSEKIQEKMVEVMKQSTDASSGVPPSSLLAAVQQQQPPPQLANDKKEDSNPQQPLQHEISSDAVTSPTTTPNHNSMRTRTHPGGGGGSHSSGLHPSSFEASSPGVDLASSEEESVAELGDVSEGDLSSVGEVERNRHLRAIAGVMAVAKKVNDQFAVPSQKSVGFDDCESIIDHPHPGAAATGGATSSSCGGGPALKGATKSDGTKASKNKTSKTTVGATSNIQSGGESTDHVDHSPTSLPRFKEPRTCMWTSSHAANAPSEDRSSSLVNVLLRPLPPNFDSETQLPPLENELYHSLIRLNLWCVIDGHGGGSVATYASEVLLPHIAASVSRELGCEIVSRGTCLVNGQLRDANALDLDGLIKTADRSPANPNSIHYRSAYEGGSDGDNSDDEGHHHNHDPRSSMRDDTTTAHESGHESQVSNHTEQSLASSSLPRSSEAASNSSVGAASNSSMKTSANKTAASPGNPRDAPVGTHSPSEVARVTNAITKSFLAVDEGWINSIDPVATHQTSCQSNGRWNSGACALTVFTIQRLEWTTVSDDHRDRELQGPTKFGGHDTSQNKDAARRRMLDYATRAKSASSLSTISSTSSMTTTDGRVHTSGLESEITETEGEEDDHSSKDKKARRRGHASSRQDHAATPPKESLISAPGGCSCHCYQAYDALLYTAHVGDCRAVLLGSAPPRTIKVHGSTPGQPDATDDESSHHSSDETECLSSSDHDADTSDDDDIDIDRKLPPATPGATPSPKTAPKPLLSFVRPPARRQSRRRTRDDVGPNAPFIALPPLEGFRSVEIEIESDEKEEELRGPTGNHRGRTNSDASSSSSENSREMPPAILLPPVTRPIDLTTDHSAYNPAEVTAVLRRCNNAPRAISAGVGGGIKRVAGSLAVTRALGDAYLKTPFLSFSPYKQHAPYISARPEVNCRPIAKNGDKVLILATDGVWERASGEDTLRWVRNFYAERIAEADRTKNRRLNQPERVANAESSVTGKKDDDSDDRNECDLHSRKREALRAPNPPAKRRKLRSGRPHSDLSQRNNSVADVIVRRVLNKVRRTRNISSLHALMSLPPGRARRSKHDDVTACVVDISGFVS